MPTIAERKDSHLAIAAKQEIQYRDSSGFDNLILVHTALPEINLKSIDCSTKFLGKTLSAPILITGMTGGTEKGGAINQKLAKAAEKSKVALGLGSQRPMLKDEKTKSFYAVRSMCPSVPLIGNIGAVNLREYPLDKIEWLVSSIEADALAIHLNPLQEAIQPEGDTDFSGVLKSIGKVCEILSVPVIVKETGAGISGPVAQKLFGIGVKYVECSGSGGTSWSKVEYARGGRLPGFEEWGYSSVLATAECAAMGPTLASGGLRSGLDVAKAIALGAKLGGAALPFYKASDPSALANEWREQIKTAMFLCGAKDLSQLSQAPLLVREPTADLLRQRGIEPALFATRSLPGDKLASNPNSSANHYI